MTSKHGRRAQKTRQVLAPRFPYRALVVAGVLVGVAAIVNLIAASVALFGL